MGRGRSPANPDIDLLILPLHAKGLFPFNIIVNKEEYGTKGVIWGWSDKMQIHTLSGSPRLILF